MLIHDLIDKIYTLGEKYCLNILMIDYTDITLVARLGYSFDIFIHIYCNSAKSKLNLALIVSNMRVYGVDKEGGVYHEHPEHDPQLHIPLQKAVELEDFIVKSIEIL